VTANNADGLAGAINAFNDKASQTGVTAKLNTAGDGITLTNATGNDMLIMNRSAATSVMDVGLQTAIAGSNGAAAAGNSSSVTGQIILDSSSSFGTASGRQRDGRVLGGLRHPYAVYRGFRHRRCLRSTC
jgi:flagellin